MVTNHRRWMTVHLSMYAVLASVAIVLGQDAPKMRPRSRCVFTTEQAARGERTYKAECARCHGAEAHLSQVPVFIGQPFFDKWRDQSIGDVFLNIKVNMPEDAPGRLSDQEY